MSKILPVTVRCLKLFINTFSAYFDRVYTRLYIHGHITFNNTKTHLPYKHCACFLTRYFIALIIATSVLLPLQDLLCASPGTKPRLHVQVKLPGRLMHPCEQPVFSGMRHSFTSASSIKNVKIKFISQSSKKLYA